MFQNSFQLTKILGIKIEISYSWFLIFFLITTNLYYVFQSDPYLLGSLVAFFTAISTALLFFGSVLFHELSHSVVAKRLGINVPKITLFIFGGMAQIEKDADTPRKEFKIAIAGPLSSILLSFIFGLSYFVLAGIGISEGLAGPFMWLSVINLTLAIFNLVPGYPMDGGRVFRSIIWHFNRNQEKATKYASFISQLFAAFLIIAGSLSVLSGRIDGLWFILIGWFLNNAAAGSYQQLVITNSLENYLVRDIMSSGVISIPKDITLSHLLDEFFFRYKLSRFPVIEHEFTDVIEGPVLGEKLVGIITLHDLKKVPRGDWHRVLVGDVMEKIPKEMLISPDQKVIEALMAMSQGRFGHMLVTENDDLVGIITRTDIVQMLQIKNELER